MKTITQLGFAAAAALAIVGLITGATAAFYAAALVGVIALLDYVFAPSEAKPTEVAPAPTPVVEEVAPTKKRAPRAPKATAPAAKKPVAKKTAPAAKKTVAKKTTKK